MNIDFRKIKNIVASIASAVSVLGIIWACGRLIMHDIPALISGYEEIAIETEEEMNDYGQSYERATKTVNKRVEVSEAIGMIIENLMIGVLSAGVLITYPIYREYSE